MHAAAAAGCLGRCTCCLLFPTSGESLMSEELFDVT